LRLLSLDASIRRVQERMKPYIRPGVSEVDEFIVERRTEAARE